jgi:hypothetical protein
MFRVILTVGLFSVVISHLCLIDPHQRGSMVGINMAAANDCLRLKSPCGGMEEEMPMVSYKAGGTYNFTFQKNLNHYDEKTPGSLSLALWDSTYSKMTMLSTVMDTNTTSPWLYVVKVQLPDDKMDHAVLQAVYNTSNPSAPPAFYQCADIMLV